MTRSADARADELLRRLSIEEKVGLLLHGTAPSTDAVLGGLGAGTAYDLDAAAALVHGAHVTSMITRLGVPPAELAAQNNALQEIALSSGARIPLTISSDPRHHRHMTLGASVTSQGFSQWPGTLGLAAVGDRELVRRFGDVVRREYCAVGIHMALSPQADLATEPRWPRSDGTFGEDPALVRALVGAYVEGVQGGTDGIAAGGVAAVVKHWVGYGASRDGFDGHNHYGRFSAFPGGCFDDHVAAFADALAFGVAAVMPTYNILDGVAFEGEPLEAVGAGFNRQLLDGLLRRTHGFGGLVLSDWAITRDLTENARTGAAPATPADIAMPWGVEHLSRVERFAKGVNAGLDQIGGENDPQPLLDAVRQGLVSEERVDAAAHRVLALKFALGLFDEPFVDPGRAAEVVGCADHEALASDAQRRSLTVLQSDRERGGPLVHRDDTLYVHGLDRHVCAAAGCAVVDDPSAATVAVVRIAAPFQRLHPNSFFGGRQHEGELDFKPDDPTFAELADVARRALRTIVVVHLDRAAILTNVREHASVLVADFGVADAHLVDALMTGRGLDGRLPFELPSSMAAVVAQAPDRPSDSSEPLFPIFHHA